MRRLFRAAIKLVDEVGCEGALWPVLHSVTRMNRKERARERERVTYIEAVYNIEVHTSIHNIHTILLALVVLLFVVTLFAPA